MLRFIGRRIYYGVFVLIGVVTLVFFLFNILPGDPARMMLGQRADMASVEAINRELGLDKPVYEQYLKFVNDLSPLSFHNMSDKKGLWYPDSTKYAPFISLAEIGKTKVVLKLPYLGRSYQSKRKVSEILAQAFPNTMLLATVSMGFAVIISLIIGVASAIRKDSFFDRASLFIAVLGMSLPSFFAAILMAWLFAYVLADYTGLSMFGSLYSVDDFGCGEYLDLKNIILPAITLGIRPLAIIIELTRSSMLEVLSQDYIRTAHSKGLSERRVILKHGLRNALNPIVTTVSGWFASLMAGAVFVEYIFDWKGIGVVIVDGLEKYDFPVVMGAVLFIAVLLVIINIFVDIIYAWLDPRVKLA
ncbi:MAG TPA: ABC transporter permease [Lentimicrobium sp.]|nr:ABC transporter permease [Lentimicrobium sp.]